MNAAAASRAMYGLLAEFDETSALVAAAHELRRRGYRRIEGYTPFPVEGLAEAWRVVSRRRRLWSSVMRSIGQYGMRRS